MGHPPFFLTFGAQSDLIRSSLEANALPTWLPNRRGTLLMIQMPENIRLLFFSNAGILLLRYSLYNQSE
jgi:hypothetical protein